ncbi:hypothetical protein FBU59_002813 [Linderina macrospora]|uniref:Uncharacterized protein n=1 Tax=Linderina macrospora TaxID=4868 RepID=A0ACC1JA07_9FUNG|nr:hypothetical protein FBU59_002813 [Linderina macrospora]
MGSNGTFVNSKLVEDTVDLSEGDEIVLLYDSIDAGTTEHAWLGQDRVVDSHGYPGKYSSPNSAQTSILAQHRRNVLLAASIPYLGTAN